MRLTLWTLFILRSTGSEPNPQPRSRLYLRTDRSVCPPISIVPFFYFLCHRHHQWQGIHHHHNQSCCTTFCKCLCTEDCPTLQRHNLWHEMRILWKEKGRGPVKNAALDLAYYDSTVAGQFEPHELLVSCCRTRAFSFFLFFLVYHFLTPQYFYLVCGIEWIDPSPPHSS
jgi:hypothetical protein